MYLLRFGNPVVGHHLFEAIVVAAVAELVGRRIGAVAGFADHLRPVADEEAAAIQIRQDHVVIGGCERRIVGVLLIGQRLVAEVGDRIGLEHRADSEGRARRRLAGRGKDVR